MIVKFYRSPHPPLVSLHYLFGGMIGLFGTFVIFFNMGFKADVYEIYKNPIGYFVLFSLAILSTLATIWGAIHFYRYKKNMNFPLWGYAVRKILKSMYTKKGLKNPILVLPYIDRDGEKYVNFWFSIRFPLHLFPIEIMVKYNNLPKVGALMDEIAGLIAAGKVERIEYEKDENYVPKGIKLHFKDGSVKEYTGEVVQDLVFFMSMKKMRYEKIAEQLRKIRESAQKFR